MSKRPSASKASTKTPPKKVAGTKPAAARKPAKAQVAKESPKRETVATLRTHVDGIAKRLKSADSQTRKSVQSVENAFSALEKQVKDHQTINHAALTRRVDQLTRQLKQTIDTAKQSIAADLKTAMDNPTISTLTAAVSRSENRLSETETAQAHALAKINRNIGELARIIDGRLQTQEGQSASHSQKLSSLEIQLEDVRAESYKRIGLVEEATVKAVRQFGDDLVNTSGTLQKKLDQQGDLVRAKISDIAEQTQKDFEGQKSLLTQRMGNIENNQRTQNISMDQAIERLTTRIDNLEYGLATPEPTLSTLLETQPVEVFPETSTQPGQSHFLEPEAPELEFTEPSFEDNHVQNAIDKANPYSDVPVQNAEFAPYTAPETDLPASNVHQFEPQQSTYEPGVLQEYQPEVPAQHPQSQGGIQQHQYVDSAPNPYGVDPVQGNAALEYNPYSSANASQALIQDAPPFQQAQPELAPSPYIEPQAETAYPATQFQPGGTGPAEYSPPQEFGSDDLPYADPGYGEGQPQSSLTRPGHVESIKDKKKSKRKSLMSGSALSSLPISPRNLKIAGLAVILAGVLYFGLRSYIGKTESAQPTNMVPPVETVVPVGIPTQQILTSDPIGEYQDNQGAPEIDPATLAPTGSDGQTLQSAADSGNPIAEFQLGTSYLDAGHPAKGLKYIRASANQGQPAAQYRLAKLYEAGIGVAADPDMARQLIERSARAGNRIAMHDLGLYYAEGHGGVERNMDTAFSWFEKAAERGIVDSQYNLGVLLESSPDIARDPASSLVWYSIAAAQGDQLAGNRVDVLKAELSKDDLKQVDRRIAQFKPASIDQAAHGIFPQVPWTMPQTQSIAPSADLIKDVQSLLGELGYDAGTPDGAAGPKTRTAVIAFERASGLPETGTISATLVNRLEAAAGV